MLHSPRTLHVDNAHRNADDFGEGTHDSPLRTVGAAAALAEAGDTVRIHAGTYRECVRPARGGEEGAPITYEAAPGEEVWLKGSEVWQPAFERVAPGIMRAPLDVALFQGGANPYVIEAFCLGGGQTLGQVFCRGELLFEVGDEAELRARPGTWMAEAGGESLMLHFPLGGENAALELTVRAQIFAPLTRGLGYITLRNLNFEHGVNQSAGAFWAEGFSPQAGLVSCRSGHHFVIEGCTIRHAKTIGLDCGREGGDRPLEGQSTPPLREVGYHLIQNNTISDNGECGLMGLGHVGTRVIGNRVERNNARGFMAVEEAGIKFHYFVDGVIEGNLVRGNDAHGIWLDNVWHGSRVSRNVCLNNVGSGIFIELGDGPLLVDNNVCAGTRVGEGIYTHDAGGVTLAHNLLLANAHFGVYCRTVSDRLVESPAYSGKWQRVATTRQQIQNNAFADNYRGAICLATPGARDRDNHSDHNLFLGGAQWQWEAHPFAAFALSGSDGDARTDGESEPARLLSLEEWRRITGWDTHSAAPVLEAGEVVNGALQKGGLRFAEGGLWIDMRDARALAERSCPPIKGTELDLNGVSREGGASLPGPWAHLDEGYNRLPLWPLAPARENTP